MQIIDSTNDLLKELAGLSLLHPLMLDNILKQLSPTRILHNQVQLLARLYDLIQLYYIGVSNQFQDMDLPRNSLHIRNFWDFVLF